MWELWTSLGTRIHLLWSKFYYLHQIKVFLVGAFKCSTLTVGSFFKTRKVHFFVHSFNNLNYGGSKHSKLQNLVQSKKKPDVQILENILRIPFGVFHIFFSTDLFENFLGLHQRVPLQFFSSFATNWSFKKPKGPPFTISKTLRFLSLRYGADFGRFRLVSNRSHPRLEAAINFTLKAIAYRISSNIGREISSEKLHYGEIR